MKMSFVIINCVQRYKLKRQDRICLTRFIGFNLYSLAI